MEIGRYWWWLLLIVVLAGLGYYTYSQMNRKPPERLATKKVAPGKTKPLSQKQPTVAGEKKDTLPSPAQEEPLAKTLPDKDDCTRIETSVAEFFQYLDHKRYVQHLYPDTDTFSRAREILTRLAKRPPIPAGEGIDPTMIIKNVYHLYRVLDHKDLRLIREVLRNEQDTMELNLNLFYGWLTSGERCPEAKGFRPSTEISYHYAGFFLNTLGGRAYLFRRPSGIRLLVTYYCLLIVHEADKRQKNNYGIDIFPFIAPLKEDMSYHPGLQFKNEYIEHLPQMQLYYLQKR